MRLVERDRDLRLGVAATRRDLRTAPPRRAPAEDRLEEVAEPACAGAASSAEQVTQVAEISRLSAKAARLAPEAAAPAAESPARAA
jgi:hypothetical protein